MDSFPSLLKIYFQQIEKATFHLAYSYQKILVLPSSIEQLDTTQLEAWEGFVSRFNRLSDIFLSKYIRTSVLQADPAFRGSLRDFVEQAEKLALIEDSDTWMSIRELRNNATHEYLDAELSLVFSKMRDLCPLLLTLKDTLKNKK